MAKVIIISYFYPPSAFVGGERTRYWAENLHKYGWYPIIITRQWNEKQQDLVDKVQNNKLEVERFDTHEVHRLPYKRSIRDKCADQKWLKPLQKLLTLWEVFFSNYFISALPYSNFYSYSRKLILEEENISFLISSGRPFQSFFFGYKLKQDYPQLYWIPDYRDEWNSSRVHPKGIIGKFIQLLENKSEKKWVSNASAFFTVSQQCLKKIESFTDKRGYEVKNGYEETITPKNKGKVIIPSKNSFKIAYVGTLYPNQDVERFIEVINDIQEDVTMFFIGSDILLTQKQRLKQLKSKYPFIRIVEKLSKQDLYDNLQHVDLFYASAYDNVDGCLPVKAFDYILLKKPILLFPSDGDLFENFIKKTNRGIVPKNNSEAKELLRKYVNDKKRGTSIEIDSDDNYIQRYSRAYQTKRLASYLIEIMNQSK